MIALNFQAYARGIPIIFTFHAKDRLKQCRLDEVQARIILSEAVESPFKVSQQKKRFTRNQEDVTYWMYGSIIFTILKTKDKKKIYDDIFLVLTVTETRAVDYHLRKKRRRQL